MPTMREFKSQGRLLSRSAKQIHKMGALPRLSNCLPKSPPHERKYQISLRQRKLLGTNIRWSILKIRPNPHSPEPQTSQSDRTGDRSHSGRLLDVGSASGFFAVAARSRGFDVTCLEPATTLASYGRDEYGLDFLFLSGQLRKLSSPPKRTTSSRCGAQFALLAPSGILAATPPIARGKGNRRNELPGFRILRCAGSFRR